MPFYDFLVDFLWYFHMLFRTHVDEPIPKLRNHKYRVVITLRVDEGIGVKKIQH